MRFMMMIKSDAQEEAGIMPDQQVFNDMSRFNEEIAGAGVMLSGEGLKSFGFRAVAVNLNADSSAALPGPAAVVAV